MELYYQEPLNSLRMHPVMLLFLFQFQKNKTLRTFEENIEGILLNDYNNNNTINYNNNANIKSINNEDDIENNNNSNNNNYNNESSNDIVK